MNTELETKIINEHVDKGNYHAAINIAISAMNEYHRNHDQPGVDKFLSVIKGIVQTMTEEFGSKIN